MNRRSSLSIILYVSAVVCVYLIGLAVVSFQNVRRSIYDQMESRAFALADEIGYSFEALTKNGDGFALRRVVEQSATIPEVKSVGVTNRTGRFLAHNIPSKANTIATNPLIEQAVKTEQRQVSYGNEEFVVVEPLRGTRYSAEYRSDVIGAIVVTIDLGPVNARFRNTAIVVLTSTAVFMGFLALSLVILTNRLMVRPLVRLTTTLEEREHALEEARDAAEAANRAKSTFLANMSHELRTPLNAILGYSQILQLQANDRGDGELAGTLERIRVAGKNLLGIISNVLDLSKIEAGRMEVLPERFEVQRLIHEVITTVEPLVTRNQNQLQVDFEPDLGEMVTDRGKVQQSLLNLLSNAAKFTDHGTITFAISRESNEQGDWLVFSVADSGIGMTAEQQQILFQAFSQVNPSSTRRHGGTGLGLDISRRFCRMIGGDITVESEAGRGSTFTMRVPASLVGASLPLADVPQSS